MKKYILGLAMALCATTAAEAEVTVSGGVDLVSSYVWRGIDQTGPAFQPAMDVSAGNFSLSAWGSTPFAGDAKELDFTLGYGIGGFSISVTDYWWSGEGVPYFCSIPYNTSILEDEEATSSAGQHQQEVSVGFEFGEGFPLSITWSTMVAGDLDKSGDDQMYSTYINLAYPFAVSGVDCTASVGITPWEGAYASQFDVASVALCASKSIAISDKFELPIFVEVSAAPANHDAYLVAGVSFAF